MKNNYSLELQKHDWCIHFPDRCFDTCSYELMKEDDFQYCPMLDIIEQIKNQRKKNKKLPSSSGRTPVFQSGNGLGSIPPGSTSG